MCHFILLSNDCTWVHYQVAENLAQLMYSVMMTGYMFKNAQYRLELQQSLEQVALPDVQDKKVLHPARMLFYNYPMKDYSLDFHWGIFEWFSILCWG